VERDKGKKKGKSVLTAGMWENRWII